MTVSMELFDHLSTKDGLKAFLIEYHRNLKLDKSFPPLGIQKALHVAAKSLGHTNWHEMNAWLKEREEK